ncbi:MAG: hypothetical protein H7319_13620 [Spirosoma sp.]|nr:hypothetical protein [Spirosoma sp.]
MSEPIGYQDNIFINCPFDTPYQPLFRAIVFTIQQCGFAARCALEEDSTGDVRIQKIIKIIDECRYGVHDISKADLDENSQLARFNMPLELGIFIGAHHFAPSKSYNSTKKYIVMDTEPYRYQKFISDLGGQDIKAYGTDASKQIATIIQQVRDFLRTSSRRKLPGPDYLTERYETFLRVLPSICSTERLDIEKLTYLDYLTCAIGWLTESQEQ